MVALLAGVIVGLSIGAQGGASIVIAGAGVLATVATTVVARSLDERAWTRSQEAAARIQNRDRFEAHSDRLNEQVYSPLQGLGLIAKGDSPSEDDTPPGTGLGTGPPGYSPTTPVEVLQNYGHAMSHLEADARLSASWDAVKTAAATYYRSRKAAIEKTTVRFLELGRREWGAEVAVADLFHPTRPPWIDARGLAWFSIARRQGWGKQDTSASGGPGEFYLGFGSGRYVCLNSKLDVDLGRLQGIWDNVWEDSELRQLSVETATTLVEAKSAVAAFSSAIKRFSDTITLSHTFEGECEVCKRWRPR